MTEISYTTPALVTEHKVTVVPWSGRTVSGYGGRIPTRHMIRYAGRWQRVRVMVYGNAGSAYITVKGQHLFLDTDTEWSLSETV